MTSQLQPISCCSDFYQLPIVSLLLGDSFHPGGLTLTRKLASKTLVNRKSLVLDIAAGKAASAKFICEHYGAKVYAVDLGLENLQLIPRKSDNQQLFPIIADATLLPFTDNCFDVVFCECALCTFKNRDSALKEIYRVLKPGGFIAISDIYLNSKLPKILQQQLTTFLCISGALSTQMSQATIVSAGFEQVKFYDESEHLLSMVSSVESKIEKLQHAKIIAKQLSRFGKFNFKQLGQYIKNKGAGYYLLTARKAK